MALARVLKATNVQPEAHKVRADNAASQTKELDSEVDESLDTTPSIGAKSVRMTLVLPPKSSARLETLKEVTEAASYAEIIRNAIRVYEALVMEHDSGTKFFVKRNGGKGESVEYKIF